MYTSLYFWSDLEGNFIFYLQDNLSSIYMTSENFFELLGILMKIYQLFQCLECFEIQAVPPFWSQIGIISYDIVYDSAKVEMAYTSTNN